MLDTRYITLSPYLQSSRVGSHFIEELGVWDVARCPWVKFLDQSASRVSPNSLLHPRSSKELVEIALRYLVGCCIKEDDQRRGRRREKPLRWPFVHRQVVL